MDKFQRYTERLGFSGLEPLPVKNKSLLRAFRYEAFDAVQVRAALGKSTKHRQSLFVFRIARDKAVRVDTVKKQILLGNTPRVVKAFLASVGDDK